MYIVQCATYIYTRTLLVTLKILQKSVSRCDSGDNGFIILMDLPSAKNTPIANTITTYTNKCSCMYIYTRKLLLVHVCEHEKRINHEKTNGFAQCQNYPQHLFRYKLSLAYGSHPYRKVAKIF